MKLLKQHLTKLTLILIMCTFSIKTEHIFFDMGGVLLKQSKFRSLCKLGPSVIGHLDLRKRFFEFLHFIDEDKSNKNNATFQGDKMPAFLCRWQEGLVTSDEISNYIVTQVESNPQFFKNRTEQKLIKQCGLMLIGKNHVGITKQIKSMVKLLKTCKEQKDGSGKQLNTIYLTSNCDIQTFQAYKEKFPQIFELFDADKIILSGEINIIKPSKDFYKHVIDKFNLNPKHCTLIDDQIENIKAFNELVGEDKGILYTNTSKTKSRLKQIGAFNEKCNF
jgi:FMN phosphatase YigB (HAD superfamily)